MVSRKRISKYTDIARLISLDLDERFKHVSIIIAKRQIVSIGTNKRKTHTKAKQVGYRFSCLHSEMDAYLKVPNKNLKNMILINFRFNKQGLLRNAKPCIYCQKWCIPIFKEIWYSTSENRIEKL